MDQVDPREMLSRMGLGPGQGAPGPKPEPTTLPVEEDPIIQGLSDYAKSGQKEAAADVGTRVDLNGDGSVVKIITVQGKGALGKPPKRAEVTVHYTGTLADGTVFDDSRARDEPFVFKAGVGEVIKGWDLLIETMVDGERAVFTIAPEYAYGEKGYGDIPANATLTMDVELISWIELRDLSQQKDGSILSKNLVKGGWESPEFSAIITVSWKLTLLYDTKVLEEKEDFTFEFGVGGGPTMNPGLEYAISDMMKGERSLVQIAPHQAFGSQGCPDINVPPDEFLQYDITLVNIKNPPTKWSLSGPDRFQKALDLKNEANQLLKEGKIKVAVLKYKLGLKYLEDNSETNPIVDQDQEGLTVTLHLNIAAVAIKTEVWAMVLQETNAALKLQPKNPKALLRRGKAYVQTAEEEKGQADLTAAANGKDPEVAENAKAELAKLRKKIKIREDRIRAVYKKNFEAAVDAGDKKPEPAHIVGQYEAKPEELCVFCKKPGHRITDCPAASSNQPPADMTVEEAFAAMEELQRDQKIMQEKIQYAENMAAEAERVQAESLYTPKIEEIQEEVGDAFLKKIGAS